MQRLIASMTEATRAVGRWFGKENPTCRGNSFVFLRDQHNLSEKEWKIVCDVRETIKSLIHAREDYIMQNRLDSEIHSPATIWRMDRSNEFSQGFQRVLDGDYSIINHLRLFSQQFTGYRLISMEFAEGKPFPRKVPETLDQSLEKIADQPDRFVELYKKLAKRIPLCLHVTPPCRFGEIGWCVDGKIVNYDTYAYLERLVLLYEHGVLKKLEQLEANRKSTKKNNRHPLMVLEIGGGFGGFAHHLKKLFPHMRYYIIDLPEALAYSAIYLSVLHKHEQNECVTCESPVPGPYESQSGFTFVSNYLFDKIVASKNRFDLVINTLSMSEMSEKQVRYYCEHLRGMLGENGVFFEQNQDNRPNGQLDARSIIEEYFPYKVELDSHLLNGCTQGRAHLWSNSPITTSLQTEILQSA